MALARRARHGVGAARPVGGVDDLGLLAADGVADDRHQRGVGEQGLEHRVAIGVHLALHDRLAQAPRGVDDHHLGEARLRVEREHHAGAPAIGADHALHAHRQRHVEVVVAVLLAVGDGAVAEERGHAVLVRPEQVGLAHHVEVALLLPGERGVGQVLGGGRRPHRHGEVVHPVLGRERPVVGHQLGGQVRRDGGGVERGADRLPHGPQRVRVPVQGVDLLLDDGGQAVVLEDLPIGRRRGGEAVGHADPGGGQVLDHLAERRVLAPHQADVADGELAEGDGAAGVGHGWSSSGVDEGSIVGWGARAGGRSRWRSGRAPGGARGAGRRRRAR